MKRTIIESPFAGDVRRNIAYLRLCMADCLARGEAPIASHALYTQPGVLRDDVPEERTKGINAGFAWWSSADVIAFYTDFGWSRGMEEAHRRLEKVSMVHKLAIRTIPNIGVRLEHVEAFGVFP